MKIPVLQLATVSRIHWEFCCCLDRDLLPVAQICKEGGERFWAFWWVFGLVWAKVGRSPDLSLQEGKREAKNNSADD